MKDKLAEPPSLPANQPTDNAINHPSTRPAGWAGRAYKWSQQNPLLVTFSAVLVMLVLIGVVSFGFMHSAEALRQETVLRKQAEESLALQTAQRQQAESRQAQAEEDLARSKRRQVRMKEALTHSQQQLTQAEADRARIEQKHTREKQSLKRKTKQETLDGVNDLITKIRAEKQNAERQRETAEADRNQAFRALNNERLHRKLLALKVAQDKKAVLGGAERPANANRPVAEQPQAAARPIAPPAVRPAVRAEVLVDEDPFVEPIENDDPFTGPFGDPFGNAPAALNASRSVRNAVTDRSIVGRFLSPGQVLLAADNTFSAWRSLPVQSVLTTGQMLVVPPGGRVTIMLMRMTVEIDGDSMIELTGLKDGVPEITLNYGRLVIRSLNTPNTRMRIRVGGQTGTLVLEEPASIAGVEVRVVPNPGKDPEATASPRALDLFAAEGNILWQTRKSEITIKQGNRHTGLSHPDEEFIKNEIPRWIARSDASDQQKRALSVIQQALTKDDPAVKILSGLIEDDRPEVSRLAVRCCSQLGQFDQLIKSLNHADLNDDKHDQNDRRWNEDIATLKQAIARDPELAFRVRAFYEQLRPGKGLELYRMLWGYSRQDLLRDGDALLLVNYLDNAELDFRVLSFWNLRAITGVDLGYRPEETDEAKQKKQFAGWRTLLKEKNLVPASYDASANGEEDVQLDAAGSFALRTNRAAREAAIERGGGNIATEAAVAAALDWLAKHQNRNGSWSWNHTVGDKCSGFANPGDKNSLMGATGLALMPFLNSGYTHKQVNKAKPEYQTVVDKALTYLVNKKQVANNAARLYDAAGPRHEHMYSHGIATCALVEAYGMTEDRQLKLTAQRSINYIVQAQHPQSGGWLYVPRSGGDTSVVGWQVMALKSGTMAGLQFPGRVTRLANTWLDSVQSDLHPAGGGVGSRYGYKVPNDRHPSGWKPNPSGSTTAIGLLCRTYLGTAADVVGLKKGLEWIAQRGPSKADMYYNYYATQLMFHADGPRGEMWKKWNAQMRNQLIATQLRTGADAGSWYFAGNHGDSGGRLYCTALAAMTLQIYYRYANVEDDVEEPVKEKIKPASAGAAVGDPFDDSLGITARDGKAQALRARAARAKIKQPAAAASKAASSKLETIYKSLEITAAEAKGSPFDVGDVVTVTYKLTNTTDSELTIPADVVNGRLYHHIGLRQHWIKRNGNDSTIAAIPPQIARRGPKYAAGFTIIPRKRAIGAGESISFNRTISTKGYPAGNYTYYIQYKKWGGGIDRLIQTAEVEFELKEVEDD